MKKFHIIPLAIVVTFGLLSQEMSCSRNLALKGFTRQSSFFIPSRGSSLAVDGNTNSNFSSGSCIHTKKKAGWHWWFVRLKGFYTVRHVRITNRADCCGSSLRNFTIEVSKIPIKNQPGYPQRTNAPTCLTVMDPVPTSGPITYECNQSVIGMHIRIVKESPDNSPLMLCEFEVYGTSIKPPNLARGRPATQSSTLKSVTSASKAVDGNDNDNLRSGSCSHTKDINAWHWWQVDLLDSYTISNIVITKRGGYTLQGISIQVSEEEPSTLPGFPKTTNASFCLKHTPSRTIAGNVECNAPTKGRYVRILKESMRNMPLVLCEVKVFAISTKPFNIALAKPATQSSMLHPMFDANNAVDGINNGNLASGSCSQTNDLDSYHWWQVDLQDTYVISAVRITNSKDCCRNRLQNFTIEVSEEKPSTLPGFPQMTNAAVCIKHKTEIPGSSPALLECNQPVKGRYIRIVKNNDNGALTLCEVEVYGKYTRPNIAYGKPAKQSGTFLPFGHASHANDGNLNGLLYWRSCSHTQTSDNWQWWQVDLQEMYTISAVRIANRIDCCPERLQGFTIEVSVENPSTLPGFPQTTNASICLKRKEQIPRLSPLLLECDEPVTGRYLRVVKNKVFGPLTMCEIEVYGLLKQPQAPTERRLNGKNGLWRFIYVASQGSRNLLTSALTTSASSALTSLMFHCARQRLGDRTDLYTNSYIHVDLQTRTCRFFDYIPDSSDQDSANWVIYKLE